MPCITFSHQIACDVGRGLGTHSKAPLQTAFCSALRWLQLADTAGGVGVSMGHGTLCSGRGQTLRGVTNLGGFIRVQAHNEGAALSKLCDLCATSVAIKHAVNKPAKKHPSTVSTT